MTKKRMILMTVGVSSLITASAAGWWAWNNLVGVPGQLYRYYPQSTGFYLELAPGEKLTKRFITYLDEQAAQEDRLEQEHASQTDNTSDSSEKGIIAPSQTPSSSSGKTTQTATPATTTDGRSKTALLPPVPQTNRLDKTANKTSASEDILIAAEKTGETMEDASKKAIQEQERKQKRFRRAFLQKFNSTFQAYFSVGGWPDKTSSANTEADEAGNVLVIFPLKEALSLPAIATRFDMEPSDFDQQRVGKTPYFIEKGNGTALAVVDQKLFITNTGDSMRNALEYHQKGGKNLFQAPENKTFLSQLPWFRQGTFLLNNSVYANKVLNGAPGTLASKDAPISQILPLTVGAIQAQDETHISLHTLTPIHMKAITNAPLRKDIQTIFKAAQPLDSAQHLPAQSQLMVSIAGLDKLYDAYQTHMMPQEMTRWLELTNLLLHNLHVDFRKDLIGLFSQRTVLAGSLNQSSPGILLLEKTVEKDKIINKLSTLLSAKAFPIQQSTETIGNLSIRTLDAPIGVLGINKLSYGTIDDAIAFTDPTHFQTLIDISEHKSDNLAKTPLYQAVMHDLPKRANLLLFMNLKALRPEKALPPAEADTLNPTQWLDALGASISVLPFQPNKIDLVTTRVNLSLTPGKH